MDQKTHEKKCNKKHEISEEDMSRYLNKMIKETDELIQEIQDDVKSSDYCLETFINIVMNYHLTCTSHIIGYLASCTDMTVQQAKDFLIKAMRQNLKIEKVEKKKDLQPDFGKICPK